MDPHIDEPPSILSFKISCAGSFKFGSILSIYKAWALQNGYRIRIRYVSDTYLYKTLVNMYQAHRNHETYALEPYPFSKSHRSHIKAMFAFKKSYYCMLSTMDLYVVQNDKIKF